MLHSTIVIIIYHVQWIKQLNYRTTVRIMLQNKRKLNCVATPTYLSANVVAEGNAVELSSISASTAIVVSEKKFRWPEASKVDGENFIKGYE